MDHGSALEYFASLGRIARDTRGWLQHALVRGGRGHESPGDLDVTLEHLGHVREGFVITLRTSSFRGPSEIRALVDAIVVDWSWLKPLGIAGLPPRGPVEQPVNQVLSFAHASVALGTLPRLPADAVTFPERPATYADIPVPRSPGEVLERIEEMEAVIAGGRRPARRFSHETLRRTYGYFETSAWLVAQHWKNLEGRG